MRKNDLRTKKQVIKALSIGLSAAMMMQPVSALADEMPEVVSGLAEAGEETTESTEVNPELVESKVVAVKVSFDATEEALYEGADAALTELSTEAETISNNTGCEAVAEIKGATDDMLENVSDAEDALSDVEDCLDAMQAADVSTNVFSLVAAKDVSEISSTVDKVSDDISTANQAIDADIEKSNQATTLADAVAAKNDATEVYNAVKEEYEDALISIEEKQSEYNNAIEEAKKAAEEYDRQLGSAKENSEAAADKLSNAEAYAIDCAKELEEAKASLVKSINISSDYTFATEEDAKKAAALLSMTEENTNVRFDIQCIGEATYIVKLTDVTGVNETWYERGTATAYAAGLDAVAKSEHEYSLLNRGEYEISQSGSISAGEDRWEGATSGSGHWEKGILGIPYWVIDELPNIGHYECTVSGTVTVEYAKTVSDDTEYKTFWDGLHDIFVFWEDKKEDEIKAAVKAEIESQGGIFVDMYGFNWDAKTATVVYVPGKSVSVDGYKTLAEAKSAAAQKANEEAQKEGGASHNVTTSAEDYFNFSGTLSIEDILKGEFDAEDLENYTLIDGNNSISDFEVWKAEATALFNAYKSLEEKTTDATKNVTDAKNKVDELKNQIAELSTRSQVEGKKIAMLSTELAKALRELESAKTEFGKLTEKYEDAQEAFNNKINELTPVNNNEDEDDDEEPTPVQEQAVLPVVTPAGTPILRTVATVAPVAVAEEVVEEVAEEVAPEVVIEEEETAKADAPEVEETVIEEEETPLAPAEEAAKMSWWWILVVLVLGTTGAELYRRHMVKKNAEKVEK